MAKNKYDKLITENRIHRHSDWVNQVPRDPESGKILTWLDGDIIPGAFYYESFMAIKPTIAGSFNDPPHIHPEWDEVIGMYSTNPADTENLGGEVHLTIGDEVKKITRSCSIFIPKGLQHGPLVIKKVTTPILLVTTGNYRNYTQVLPPDWDKDIKR
jgi:hypothetical protein